MAGILAQIGVELLTQLGREVLNAISTDDTPEREKLVVTAKGGKVKLEYSVFDKVEYKRNIYIYATNSDGAVILTPGGCDYLAVIKGREYREVVKLFKDKGWEMKGF